MVKGMKGIPPKQRREVRRRNHQARDVRIKPEFRQRRVELDNKEEPRLNTRQWEDKGYEEDNE